MSSSKFKVFVSRCDIPQQGIDLLSEKCDLDIYEKPGKISREELLKRIKGKVGLLCLITEKIDKELLNVAGSDLSVISTMSVGYDHLDLPSIKEKGIKVGFTPDVLTDATAELTIALLLATARRLLEANDALKTGKWGDWAPLWMNGTGLAGSTVGIFGLGRIGLATLQKLSGFKVKKFLYCARTQKAEGDALGAEMVCFDTLLHESDFVLVSSALSEETRHAFDARAFDAMKKTAIIINTSRGGLIDQDALIKALKSGAIAGAGLDVMTPEPLPTDHPLLSAPNLTVLPHIGSAERQTRIGMAVLAAQNLLAGLNGEKIPKQLC